MQEYVASTKRRILAAVIDQLILTIPIAFIFFPDIRVLLMTSVLKVNVFVLFAVNVLHFLYYYLSYLLSGSTIGQKLVGQKLVSISSEKLLPMQVAIRVLSDRLSLFFSYGLFCLIFFRFDRTHLSDWLAETKVVQDEERKSPANRKIFICLVLTLYFSISGFKNFYDLVHRTQLVGYNLILNVSFK